MKVSVVYSVPLDALDTFAPFIVRWTETYRKFAPKIDHVVDVVLCFPNSVKRVQINLTKAMFKSIPVRWNEYEGYGIDIGATQSVCRGRPDVDFMLGMTSRVYFYQSNWLEKMVEARKQHGDGLYAAATSFEACPLTPQKINNPSIRTMLYGFDPKTMSQYPYTIDSREQAYMFESGGWNIVKWYSDIGLPVKMVCNDGVYDKADWNKPPNIFRKGDQSNLLVHDKHTDAWQNASEIEQNAWAQRARGLA